MDKARWNKLYKRCVRAMWRNVNQSHLIRARWLQWAESVTGNVCFFMKWE